MSGPIVDCDVHHQLRSLSDLAPYLSSGWRERVGIGRELPGQAQTRFALPWVHYTNPHGGMRGDAVPPDGGSAGSDPDFMAEQLFGQHGVSCAVLNGGDMIALGGMAYPDLAAALASAFNEWTIERWIEHDPRFFGALVVAPQDPEQAAREIRRRGDHPRIVSVLISSTTTRIGHRMFHPIYEAAQEMGLPVTWHPGAESSGINGPLTAVGHSTSYVEAHTSITQVAQAQLVSVICEGVLERFPELRFGVIEGGVAWLPHVLWRLDREWRSVRDEVPWIKRAPSEYVRDRVRVSSQPLEEPDDRSKIVDLLATIDGEDLVMYASDYPHWDFDNPAVVLRGFPDEAKEKMLSRNALAFFDKLTVPSPAPAAG
jgi:predicted TIM-barrel fold metal-dependent hydrolase